jgi:hypothetical protein
MEEEEKKIFMVLTVAKNTQVHKIYTYISYANALI